MKNQSSANQWRLAEYTAIRNEMQSITVARYAVLAFTFTAMAAIMAGILSLGRDLEPREAALLAPVIVTSILLPSIVVNLKLSTQYHRLSAYNAIFGEPMLVQQQAFELYKKKRPRFWGYVRPVAFSYTWLLLFVSVVFLISFWSCLMFVAMLLMVGVHLYPIIKLWDAGLTGKTREHELELWREIKKEMEHPSAK